MPDGQDLDQVQFQSPTTGRVQPVPPEHWDEALKQGYKPTSHTIMYAPDTGQRGMVANSRLAEYTKQGYQTTPKTTFEKEREPQNQPGIASTLVRDIDSFAKGMFSAPNPYAGLDTEEKSAEAAQAGESMRANQAARRAEGRSTPYRYTANVAEALPLPVDVRGMEEASNVGNRRAIIGHAAAGTAATVGPFLFTETGQETLGRPVARATRAVGRTAGDLAYAVTPEKLRVPEAPKALRQAIQPSINIPRAGESIDLAGPRIQQLRQAGQLTTRAGEPLAEIKSPADLLEAVHSSKAHVWDAIENHMKGIEDLHTDTSSIADAMEKSVSSRVQRQYPTEAARIRARAATYRDGMQLREIEEAIQDANDDLRNFYKRMSPTDSPISADMKATQAEVQAARKLLDSRVEDLRGAGVQDLKREYGALRDVERAAARANAVATRQKGATLWEGLAALHAAGDFLSGDMLGAAKGAGVLAIGRWLAKLRDPNFLTEQAFQGRRPFKAAEALRREPPIDVAQGEYTGEPLGRRPGQPPTAGVPETPALPSADRPQLPEGRSPFNWNAQPMPGRVIGQLPPEPGLSGANLADVPNSPGRRLPGPGETGTASSGRIITPGEMRALPPANESELAPPRTPPFGIRTVGGRLIEAPPGIRGVGGSLIEGPPPERTAPIQEARAGQEAPTAAQPAAAPAAETNKGDIGRDRVRLAELDRKWSELTNRLTRARSYGSSKRTIERLRGMSEERNTLRRKFGMTESSQEEMPEAKDPLEAYNAAPQEVRDYIDSYAPEIQHLPQALREEELAELAKYGEAFTPLKEKLAKREAAKGNQPTREPEETEKPLGGASAEAFRGRESQSGRQTSRLRNIASRLARDESGEFNLEAFRPKGRQRAPKAEEPVLPGLESAVEEEKTAAGRAKGQELTEQFNAPPKSIEGAAGQMERLSPLFRGTSASPQSEMFGQTAQPGALPPQPRLPEKGTVAAIRTDDGGIYPDPRAGEGGRTHIQIAQDLGIPLERVTGGGWLVDGVYEDAGYRSDAGRAGEQARAQAAVKRGKK